MLKWSNLRTPSLNWTDPVPTSSSHSVYSVAGTRLLVWGPSPLRSLSRWARRTISLDTTTALKTVCRPTSFIPWCRRTRRAYSDCALSLMMRRMWWDADKWLLRVTPKTLSVKSRATRRCDVGGCHGRWLPSSWPYAASNCSQSPTPLCGPVRRRMCGRCWPGRRGLCHLWTWRTCCRRGEAWGRRLWRHTTLVRDWNLVQYWLISTSWTTRYWWYLALS